MLVYVSHPLSYQKKHKCLICVLFISCFNLLFIVASELYIETNWPEILTLAYRYLIDIKLKSWWLYLTESTLYWNYDFWRGQELLTYINTYTHTYITHIRTYIRKYIHTYTHACLHTYIHIIFVHIIIRHVLLLPVMEHAINLKKYINITTFLSMKGNLVAVVIYLWICEIINHISCWGNVRIHEDFLTAQIHTLTNTYTHIVDYELLH
jgi:hypothetical protein